MELLNTTDTKYLARLAKELRNSFRHGVYASGRRVSACKVADGSLMILADGRWDHANLLEIRDGYGRDIVASRE